MHHFLLTLWMFCFALTVDNLKLFSIIYSLSAVRHDSKEFHLVFCHFAGHSLSVIACILVSS